MIVQIDLDVLLVVMQLWIKMSKVAVMTRLNIVTKGGGMYIDSSPFEFYLVLLYLVSK